MLWSSMIDASATFVLENVTAVMSAVIQSLCGWIPLECGLYVEIGSVIFFRFSYLNYSRMG